MQRFGSALAWVNFVPGAIRFATDPATAYGPIVANGSIQGYMVERYLADRHLASQAMMIHSHGQRAR